MKSKRSVFKVALALCGLLLVAHVGAKAYFATAGQRAKQATKVTEDKFPVLYAAREFPEVSFARGPVAGDAWEAARRTIDDREVVASSAGLTLAIAILILLLRIGPADKLLARYNIKWVKSYLAVGLGVVSGGASVLITGAGIVNSATFGVIAGLASVGLHQILTVRGGLKRKT